ncbi:peptidase T [Edwardsiella ictaluri]|uniref:peptidase T n=1 Tax=Edwardsiella ictaluri TaxID=67780 RepID=UPI000D473FED|nr:peptidase T [Edwardsiella ictaluri]EKS7807991.1 peptidase T [Edwardsiella ictaluri]EKS7808305.1 peptidase T [Edwardsiella ictaluri]UCQ51785.1 peptidase T [Edwardsiella ictaluri]
MDIIELFISYTQINTTTDREKGARGIMPSSPGQLMLAQRLGEELRALGLQEVQVRENAIVTAMLPANCDRPLPTVAFFAHLDTSAEQSADTHAQVLPYHGGDLCLNVGRQIFLRQSAFPELADYVGDDLIVTDGTSLLGADDKAAIAAIMHALQHLQANPQIVHGPVKVGFVPDEEQGLRGAKAFDTDAFGADFAYTLDCCGIGELVYENWNAGDVEVIFTGASAHPMSAKGKLKNSLLMAHKFIAMLPPGEAPEYTEGREGYYWVKQLSGNSARTVLKLDIRDFTEAGYRQRMAFIRQLAQSCESLWGEGSVEAHLSDRYANVANSLQGAAGFPVEIALRAYRRCGITPRPVPMRGGYDGAVLSQKGLPCPNLFTGAHNFHSIYEYLPVKSLRAASDVVVAVIAETHIHFSAEETA